MPGGLHPPMKEILTWPKPNYVDPVTRPKYVLVFSCILGPISIALLLARLWVRIRIQRSAGWDDWLMLASLFPVMALTAIYPLITEAYGFDRHIWDVEPKLFPLQRHYVMAIYSLFTLACGMIKMSILLFYQRLSSRAVSPAFRWIARLTFASVAVYTIVIAFKPIFSCSPISGFWDQLDVKKISKGYKYKCINEGVDVVAAGVISTVQDLVVAFLPTLLCWNLQMPLCQKIALYSIFAISYSTVAIAGMRTYISYHIFFETYDITWVANDTWLWSLLELHIGSMCANAPALKVFFAQFLNGGRLTAWTRTRSKSRTTGSKPRRSTDMNTGTSSSGFTFRKNISFWKGLHSSSNSDHLSEPHTHVSTDQHGGVIQKSAHSDPCHEQRDSLPKPDYVENIMKHSSHYSHNSFDHDIEMGSLPSSPSCDGSEVHALPLITPPEPARWPRSRPSYTFSRPQQICWDSQAKKYLWKPWDRDVKDIKPPNNKVDG